MNFATLNLQVIAFTGFLATLTTPQPIFRYIRHFGRFMHKIATTAQKAKNDLVFVFNQTHRIPTHRPTRPTHFQALWCALGGTWAPWGRFLVTSGPHPPYPRILPIGPMRG